MTGAMFVVGNGIMDTSFAEPFEDSIVDGSAPLSQLEEYEMLLKMARERSKNIEVEVPETKEEPKYVVKEIMKKEDLTNKPSESKKKATVVAKEESKVVQKTSANASTSSSSSGLPLGVLGFAAVGLGAYYLTQGNDNKTSPTKAMQSVPDVKTESAPIEAAPEPITASDDVTKLPNAVEASEWIANWRQKQA